MCQICSLRASADRKGFSRYLDFAEEAAADAIVAWQVGAARTMVGNARRVGSDLRQCAGANGPGDLLVRLRAYLADSRAGKLMDCFGCLSLWIAAPMALFVVRRPVDLLITWLALSGAAFLLERLGHKPVVIQQISENPPEER
jgi:uncharacterized protein DUF1360